MNQGLVGGLGWLMSLLQDSTHVNIMYIITPLTKILPFHWFRARHMICLSFTRNSGRVIVHRLPCDSPTTITWRAVPRRLF